MQVSYDTEADALFVRLREPEGSVSVQPLEDGLRFLHYDEANELVAAEFIEVSRGINLAGIPDSDSIAAALRALLASAPAA